MGDGNTTPVGDLGPLLEMFSPQALATALKEYDWNVSRHVQLLVEAASSQDKMVAMGAAERLRKLGLENLTLHGHISRMSGRGSIEGERVHLRFHVRPSGWRESVLPH